MTSNSKIPSNTTNSAGKALFVVLDGYRQQTRNNLSGLDFTSVQLFKNFANKISTKKNLKILPEFRS